MRTRDIVCVNCGESYCETTGRFRFDRLTNPTMFRLKEPYRSYWPGVIPEDDSLHMEAVVCPGCDAPMLDAHGMARLRVEVDPLWEGIGRTKACKNVRDVALDTTNWLKERNKRIVRFRKEGWTLKQLSEQFHLSEGYISTICKRGEASG